MKTSSVVEIRQYKEKIDMLVKEIQQQQNCHSATKQSLQNRIVELEDRLKGERVKWGEQKKKLEELLGKQKDKLDS